ncbi:MAG: type II toxin-antitoxin system VapC family toxin [Deltaproteobacteria bacterium]|nr:type II toxin-antitoxin system VapC family toxin [Deltaproteobacteria bacterium]
MVIDTSAILAIYFAEDHAPWLAQQLSKHNGELNMSTVNLAETLVLIRDRQPTLYKKIEDELLTSGINFIEPDVEQARIAAKARIIYPLNFGDCFAYALAVKLGQPLLAIDSDFKALDIEVIFPAQL